jgi:flagellar hook-associated protein 1 FlgK
MTNMLDIGRSGILAYRTALAVTSENVANVGTDGYRRRDVATVTAGGGQATPVSAPTGGQGVTVVDIRRAFDALVADRARGAQAGLAAAELHQAGALAIETLMIPGDDGIDGSLRGFFDALSELATNPTDMVTRSLALRTGAALAEGISGLARGLIELRADTLGQAQAVAESAQGILAELAQVSRALGGNAAPVGAGAAAQHPLADRRDALLDGLARKIPVSVTLSEQGRPTVRLGGSAGPLLLDADRFARLSVSAADQLTLHSVAADGTARETRLLPDAELGGLSRALGAIDMATQELDAFARALVETVNTVHRGGVDLAGAPGRDMFVIDGWQGRAAAGNGGDIRFTLVPAAVAGAPTPMHLSFDATQDVWRAIAEDGTEIATGRETLLLPGLRVDLAGTARNGDRITLDPVSGRAADLRIAISDPRALAAAGAFATAPSPSNTGTARLDATLVPTPGTALRPLGETLASSPANLLGGVIGLLPAGTKAADLVSLGRAATTVLPPAPDGATHLLLTIDGIGHRFDIAGHAAESAALADALGSGALVSDMGRSLAGLGLVAGVDPSGGGLMLTRPGPGGPVAAQVIGASGSVAGTTAPAEPAGGTLQIITRNGKHVAGTPLSAVEAASLLTAQNGFLPGAVYDPAPLGAPAAAGYRGADIAALSVPGRHVATLPAPAVQFGPGLPLPAAVARELTLVDASGASARIAIPEGASAALAAGQLDAALPGVSARGQTVLELSGLAPGPVRMGLTGINGLPIEVTATLTGAGAEPLAQAINRMTAATGLRAETAPDGARLLLVQDEGHNIILSALETAGASGLRVRPAGPDGQPAGPAVDWAEGTALRQGGQVTLAAPQGFGLTEAGAALGAAPVAADSFAVTTAAAGAEVRIAFRDIPVLAEGGLAHRIDVAGRVAEAALPPGAPGSRIATTLAAELRRDAADAILTGAPLGHRPADGSAAVLRLEGAEYTLRIQNGSPVVTGPEEGRIVAAFDASNRLVIMARGATGPAALEIASAPALWFGQGGGMLRLDGKAPDAAALPAEVRFEIAGLAHVLRLGADGRLDVPAGFPGSATRDPGNGALRVELPAIAAGLRIDAAPGSGFGGTDAAVRVIDETLVIAAPKAAHAVSVTAAGALGTQLQLSNLPPEDMIVVMTGAGTLRLDGRVSQGAAPADAGALDLVVTDAARGLVALRDRTSGDDVASGVLDAAGAVTLGGLALRLNGTAASGDRFAILPGGAGSANADTALALAGLRIADPATGSPGLTDRFARLQADAGLRAAAAGRTVETARASAEAADRAQAAIGAVDLDVEAARLLELQQAYQASAQTISIARDLFDTILRLF